MSLGSSSTEGMCVCVCGERSEWRPEVVKIRDVFLSVYVIFCAYSWQ